MNREELQDFKKYLLKSGIPLEASVSKKIQKLGLVDRGEYFYERNDEIRSVDILALETVGVLDYSVLTGKAREWIHLDFLIECKYHEEKDMKWVFVPFSRYIEEPNPSSWRRDETANIFIDFALEKILTRDGYSKRGRRDYEEIHDKILSDYFPKDLAIVDKGIEIYKGGYDRNTLSTALYQLLFGAGRLVAETVEDLSSWGSLCIPTPSGIKIPWPTEIARFISLIVVTTSELYVVNQDTTIEDIKGSKSLEEIAQKVKAVIYEQPKNLELVNFIRKAFIFEDRMLKSGFFSKEDIKLSIDHFCRTQPRVLIINYAHFDEIFPTLLSEVSSQLRELSKYWVYRMKK